MSKNEPLPDYGQLAGEGMPDIPNRWQAGIVLPDLDYDAQLLAIHQTLKMHREADEELKNRIEEIKQFASKTTGMRNERAVDDLIGHFHDSVYQDAARSMAAVGMLAPFIESIFFQAFQGIGENFYLDKAKPKSHKRWEVAPEQWDCHWVRRKKRWVKDIVAGIHQLAEATGLVKHLPGDFKPTISALFAYRNKMFHHGFEWPMEERDAFSKRKRKDRWPENWFTNAESGGKIWIHYMSDTYIEHCVTIINGCIDGIGAFCNAKLRDETGSRLPC